MPQDPKQASSRLRRCRRSGRSAGSLVAPLPSRLPGALGVFLEHAARAFHSNGNRAYATRLFARARKDEIAYDLKIDEARLDAVLLEFALAGIAEVKAFSL
ncbi:hypothetical protein ABZY02_30840 [Streptomyces sp. NPDC006649]|uniref:hypothetical protein n=1 Tax=Streptomyces sp. NPDC006649 TaxID=3156896 RepID=UPI0033A7F079